jgi:hypothetical protein
MVFPDGPLSMPVTYDMPVIEVLVVQTAFGSSCLLLGFTEHIRHLQTERKKTPPRPSQAVRICPQLYQSCQLEDALLLFGFTGQGGEALRGDMNA